MIAIKTHVNDRNRGSLILSFMLHDVHRATNGVHSIRRKLCADPQFGHLNLPGWVFMVLRRRLFRAGFWGPMP